jgi:hypothetical protein
VPENQNPQEIDLNFDSKNMFRDDSYTDMKSGSIRVLTPVTEDGSRDKSRAQMFFGSTQLMTPQGPIPVQSKLAANTLEEAISNFPDTMQTAVSQFITELQKLHEQNKQEDDSRIIMPGR